MFTLEPQSNNTSFTSNLNYWHSSKDGDNWLLHVLFDNKNTSFHFIEIYYFDYNHANYIKYFDSSNHCVPNSNHLVLNYIIDFQIDYLLCYTLVIVFVLTQLVLLLVPHTLEQFPSKDIF